MDFSNNVLNSSLSLIRKYTQKASNYSDCISLAIGEPDLNTNKCIINSCIKSLNDNNTHYISSRGSDELLSKISSLEGVSKDKILVTLGASEGLFLALMTLINKDDEIIVINPSYPHYVETIKMLGGKVVFIDTSKSDFVPTYFDFIDAITSKTKAVIINTPSNPTGIVYSKRVLKMIDEVVLKYNLYLICDDVYEQVIYNDSKKYIFNHKKVIYVKSFSKTYAMTGFRIGYMYSSKEFIEQANKIHSYLSICLPKFIQDAALTALESNINCTSEFRKRLVMATSILDSYNIDYINPEGGIYIFVSIKEYGLTSIEFCDRLLDEYHVACVPGIAFNCDDFIRINFCVSSNDLEKGLSKLGEFCLSLDQCFYNDFNIK